MLHRKAVVSFTFWLIFVDETVWSDKLAESAVMLQLTKDLYDEVLDALSENGTFSCELDVTTESADISHVYV